MKKFTNKKIILIITTTILLTIFFQIYLHFNEYSVEKWLEYYDSTEYIDKISSFSFWWYIRTYGITSILAFIMPVLIVIAGTTSFFKSYRSGFIQNVCERIGYFATIKIEIIKAWISAGLILPTVSFITLLISYILFPNQIIVPHSETNGFPFLDVPDAMYEMNPYLFIVIYTILLILFSIIIVNIGIILIRYLKNMYLVMVASFITFIFIELLGQIVLGPIVANIVGIEKIANGFSIYNLYYLNAIPSLWWEIIFALFLVIISTLVIYKIYYDEEKVILSYE